MAEAREGTATVMLSSDELTQIVAEWVAKHSGVALPVQHHVEWMWSPGKGPVAKVKVESVPNVRQLVLPKVKRNG
jgi:L-lysine 2,3-aminomutase